MRIFSTLPINFKYYAAICGLLAISSCGQKFNAELPPIDAEENVISNFDKGKELLAKKQYTLSILEFDSAIAINPRIAAIYKYRGLAKAGKEEFQPAILDIKTAIDLNPFDISLNYEKANIEYEANLLDSAIYDYTKVIQKDSSFDDAYLNRGLANLKKGLKQNACIDFNLASKFGNTNALGLIEENCK